MTDLIITASGVLAANANTVKAQGLSGSAISAGQVVWLDTAQTPNLLKLAQANGATNVVARSVVGIALNSTSGGSQQLTYATAGDIILPTTGGTVLTSGSVYVLSAANAGGIAPANDPSTATYATLLGVAISPTILRVSLSPLGATR